MFFGQPQITQSGRASALSSFGHSLALGLVTGAPEIWRGSWRVQSYNLHPHVPLVPFSPQFFNSPTSPPPPPFLLHITQCHLHLQTGSRLSSPGARRVPSCSPRSALNPMSTSRSSLNCYTPRSIWSFKTSWSRCSSRRRSLTSRRITPWAVSSG